MRDWRIALVETHSRLFHSRVGEFIALHRYPNCGDGWRALLECACERIDDALVGGDLFVARQIGEKQGTLRFYWSGELQSSSRSLILDAVSRAEARSHCTCEVCGELGFLYKSGPSFVTRCIVHSEGVRVPIKLGFADLHLVQRYADDRTRVDVCRYDRAADEFVEMASLSGVDDQGKAQRPSDVMKRFGSAAPKCTRQEWPLWAPQRRNHSSENRSHHYCRTASFNKR